MRTALKHLVEKDDGTLVFDYPTDNKQTWLVKAGGLFRDAAPSHFNYAVHEYGEKTLLLADHAFGHQSRYGFVGDKLTVTENGPQSIESDYNAIGE